MALKLIVNILLLSLFLQQGVLGRPNNDATIQESPDLCHQKSTFAAMAPKEKDNTLTPSIQLLKMTLYNLLQFSMTYARKAQSTIELLLNEPDLKDNNAPEVQEFKKKIIEIQQQYATCNNINDIIKLVVPYSTFTSDYYDREEDNTLSADSKVVLNVLKKYGTHENENEFVNSFNKFVDKFSEKFDELKEKLKEEKGNVAVKILQWWETAKTLKTYDERMDAFSEYVNLYKLD